MKKTLSLLMVLAMLLAMVPAALAEEAKEPVTITFGGWGDIVLLHEQCEKFEEKYPWITVDVVKPAGKDWYADSLTQLAAEGNMPDVINIENPLQAYNNGWMYDMTDLFLSDPDSAVYPQDFLQYGVVNNKLVGLIGAMYAYGIEVNLTLLEELNIPIPEYDWTVDEWADILRKACVPGTSWGTETLWEILTYMIPSYVPGTTAAGYDKETLRLPESEGWVEFYNMVETLVADEVSTDTYIARNIDYSWTADEANIQKINDWKMENFGAADNLWLRGKIAMRMRPSWNMNWDGNNPELYTGFDYDVYPFPTLVEGELAPTALLNEFLGMSATTKHPEEAYLLVKYMTYDMDGYEAKVNHMVNYNKEAMVAKYPEIDPKYMGESIHIWLLGASTEARADEIFAKMDLTGKNKEGLAAIFENRTKNSYLLPDRYVPSYWRSNDFLNWYIQNDMAKGINSPADWATWQVTETNKEIDNAFAAYEGLTYGWTEEFLADWHAKNDK